jgi:hypothetical protein
MEDTTEPEQRKHRFNNNGIQDHLLRMGKQLEAIEAHHQQVRNSCPFRPFAATAVLIPHRKCMPSSSSVASQTETTWRKT